MRGNLLTLDGGYGQVDGYLCENVNEVTFDVPHNAAAVFIVAFHLFFGLIRTVRFL